MHVHEALPPQWPCGRASRRASSWQVESFVGLGTISKPGAWGFGDCLELGVPGEGCLTWEESKSHLALWAVCSQPLFLGNDVRAGYMQPRLLDLVLNEDMITVNQ